MLKAALLGCIGWVVVAAAAEAGGPAAAPAVERAADRASIVRVDWQDPQALPPQFRNHCGVGGWFGRPYCADHCGPGYQFYYCTPASFGCCSVGFGYCDHRGHLRCHP